MSNAKQNSYVLGLDLGVSSVGWALLQPSQQRFVAAGVRIFDSGMDENKFAKGEQGASNNVERRMARLHRRQLRRRAARRRDLFLALQVAGLLSPGRADTPEDRHEILADLDRSLLAKWRPRLLAEHPEVAAPDHVLPYFLRALALDQRLDPPELGRALYHLAQRRGYKSNRRDTTNRESVDPKADKKRAAQDDKKLVLADIAGLERDIAASGARTLGEFLSRLDPSSARIRRLHTARVMFEREFDAIWSAQQKHHTAVLTPALKDRLWNLLFFQRPICPGKPGFCELEAGCPRAPMVALSAQRFRMLQKVNDLAIFDPSGVRQTLSPEQRRRLIDRLQSGGDATTTQLKELLGLSKKSRFNLEAGRNEKFVGNRTNAAMLRLFGLAWNGFTELQQKRIVRDWADSRRSDEDLVQLAVTAWHLDESAVRLWLRDDRNHPEEGYCKLSLRALSRLLCLMEAGKSFKTAETELYGDRFSGNEEKPLLRPVEEVLPQIPNPAVMRALTEMRKVVNAIIREHGKPSQVRLELARDLKRSAKDRQRLTDRMWDNRKRREKIIARIQKDALIPSPSGRDIEKGLLFEELQECAYCGKQINFQNLFSDAPQFDIDHILPKSRFPDDSFSNKTLACAACNRPKSNRTPFEAFGHDRAQWEAIQVRISRKQKDGRFTLGRDKQKRFLLEKPEDIADFSARHLADTRYITKLAARYMEELYGGRDRQLPWEDQKHRKVFASSGMVTSTLRTAWLMEKLVARCPACREKNQKCRCDHRHHAIDAMVIALSNQAAVQQLSAAAAVGDGRIAERVSSRTLQQPWTDFIPSLQPLVDNLLVSQRPNHALDGGLHKETNYSPERQHAGKTCVHVRTPIHHLSAADIRSNDVIVDAAVRAAVQQKLELVGDDPKKLEKDWPQLVTHAGKQVPIRNVRIRLVKPVSRIAYPPRERYVETRDNHHVWIAARLNQRDEEVEWMGDVVSRLEATQRKRCGQPVVQRNVCGEGDDKLLYKFSLMRGDTLLMKDWRTGKAGLFVVNGFSAFGSGQVVVSLSRHNDARIQTDMAKSGDFRRLSPDTLRKQEARKVLVDPLGRLRQTNG